MTKLEAVNWLLEHVGTEGVAELPATHPQAVAAERKLDLATRMVLTEGWWFNTNFEVVLQSDITGYIIVEGTHPTLNVTFRNKNLRQEGDKVIDIMSLEEVPLNEALCETQVLLLPWDIIPIQAQSVILYTAAIDFVRAELEDEAKVAVLTETIKGLSSALGNQDKENIRVRLGSSKYLQAINFVLNMMGERNVYSEESSYPEAMRVKERLDWVSEDIQSKPWWFNTSRGVYLTEVNGVIPDSAGVLSVVTSDKKYVLQGNKFKDTSTGEDVSAADVLCESVSYKLPWDRLPKTVQGLIRVTAALDMLSTDINHGQINQPYENDQSKIQPLNFLKQQLEVRMREEDLRHRRINIVESARIGRVMGRIAPWGRKRN